MGPVAPGGRSQRNDVFRCDADEERAARLGRKTFEREFARGGHGLDPRAAFEFDIRLHHTAEEDAALQPATEAVRALFGGFPRQADRFGTNEDLVRSHTLRFCAKDKAAIGSERAAVHSHALEKVGAAYEI